MEELVTLGKTKSIGVSNFNIEQIKEVLKVCKIRPVCNQFEINPLWQNEELIILIFVKLYFVLFIGIYFLLKQLLKD